MSTDLMAMATASGANSGWRLSRAGLPLFALLVGSLLLGCQDSGLPVESTHTKEPLQTSATTKTRTAVNGPSPSPVNDPTPSALCQVSSVTDGDTISVTGCDDAGTVRLLLVDSPESGGDCYAAEATAYVRERLLGESVRLERDLTDTDQYDRKLRYIWIGDELFNETLVREGYAKLLVFENVKYVQRIGLAETQARAAGSGLWGACGTGNCGGPIRITALDKRAEMVTIEGTGEMTGWRLVSERGAASQRFSFPSGFVLQGSVQVLSATPRFPNSADRLWWTADNYWNNSEDDDALLYDSGGQLVCEFDDGR